MSLRPVAYAVVPSLVLALAFTASAHAALLDNFNRPNASTLGPNWALQNGGVSILNNQATETGASGSESLATFNVGIGPSASADVSAVLGSGTQYIALVLGYTNLDDNFFIKVQDNGAGTGFDSYAFYYGNNNSGYASGALTDFGNLTTAFTTGNISAIASGSTVTLDVTPTGGATQVYTWDYGVTPTGNGIGLGFYGTAMADNFSGHAVPEPLSMAVLGTGLVGLIGMRRRRAA